MHNITLIIPAKNESESLPSVLNELKQYPYKIDIILHSTDSKTIQSIKNYDVNIIYQKNFGYGDALIHGINQCKTEYFCIFNADGSFNPLEIDGMYKSLNDKARLFSISTLDSSKLQKIHSFKLVHRIFRLVSILQEYDR